MANLAAPTTRWYQTVLMALCVWREAAGEGLEGMRAVAYVILNRHLAGWGSIVFCITKRNQFSSMSVSGDAMTTHWPADTDGVFAGALILCDDITAGRGGVDPTGGALYYENPRSATSKWFIDNVRNKMQVTARIGRHVFYKP